MAPPRRPSALPRNRHRHNAELRNALRPARPRLTVRAPNQVTSPKATARAASSETPLRTTFRIRLNGATVAIATVGQAYRFLTEYSSIEWMEFRSLHGEAMALLERAADNAMLTVQATDAVRALFVSTKLL